MKRIAYLLVSFLLFSATGLRAQVGVELLENGDFEKFRLQGLYEKPVNWSINSTLSPEKSSEAHTGALALKLYLNPGLSSITYFKNTENASIEVEAGAEYELSYWYKGTGVKKNIIPEVTWYKDGVIVRPEKREEERVQISGVWQQHTVTFKAPIADHCGVALTFEGDSDGGTVKELIIDDVSFKMSKEAEHEIPLDPPSGFKGTGQQREIDLSWRPTGEAGVTYHLTMNGAALTTTAGLAYTVTGLTPDTPYQFAIRSEQGEKKSEFSPSVEIRTQGLNYRESDEDRIPYLYRLNDYGYTERTILLHWKELARPDAQIRYWIDGTPVTPSGDVLTFPKAGLQRLRIEIIETPERRWNIEYRLHVK